MDEKRQPPQEKKESRFAVTPEIEKYVQMLRKDPRSPVFAALSEAYRKGGLLDEAIAVASEGLKHNPNYISGRAALGRAYYDRGDFEKAIDELQRVIKVTPDNIIAHKLIADISIKKSDSATAIKELKTVTYLSPNDKEAAAQLKELTNPPAGLEGQTAPKQERTPPVSPPIPAGPSAPETVQAAPPAVSEKTEMVEVQQSVSSTQGPADQQQSAPEIKEEAPTPATGMATASIETDRAAEHDIPPAVAGNVPAPEQAEVAPEIPPEAPSEAPENISTGTVGEATARPAETDHVLPDGHADMREEARADEIEAVFTDLSGLPRQDEAPTQPQAAPAAPAEGAVPPDEGQRLQDAGGQGSEVTQGPEQEPDLKADGQTQGAGATPIIEGAGVTEGGPALQEAAPAAMGAGEVRPGLSVEEAAGSPQPGEEKAEQPAGTEPEDIQTITMADLYVKQGHFDKAYEIYKKILVKSPESSIIRTKFIKVKKLMESKQPEEQGAEIEREKIAALREHEPKPFRAEEADSVKENMKRLNSWLDKIKKGG